MSTQRIDLNVEARTVGKHFSRSLRNESKIPAIVYGAIDKNINISIAENAVIKYNSRNYENALFNLKSTDKALNDKVVLIKAVSVHPLSRKPVHVDLFAIDLKKAVRINVEIRLEGKPIGLAEGGLLNLVNRQIEVECLPTAIPEFFTIEVSHLGVGDAVHVSDIKFPEGVKPLSASDLTIAVVNQEDDAPAATPAAVAAPTAAAAKAPAGKAAPAAAKAPAKAPAKK